MDLKSHHSKSRIEDATTRIPISIDGKLIVNVNIISGREASIPRRDHLVDNERLDFRVTRRSPVLVDLQFSNVSVQRRLRLDALDRPVPHIMNNHTSRIGRASTKNLVLANPLDLKELIHVGSTGNSIRISRSRAIICPRKRIETTDGLHISISTHVGKVGRDGDAMDPNVGVDLGVCGPVAWKDPGPTSSKYVISLERRDGCCVDTVSSVWELRSSVDDEGVLDEHPHRLLETHPFRTVQWHITLLAVATDEPTQDTTRPSNATTL